MSDVLNAKFLRAFDVRPATQNGTATIAWILRLMYEFWGFCVNGGDDLRLPEGGFASSHLTGSYLHMAEGFETGSTVLLASGSDGVTDAGMPYVSASSSSPFKPEYVGKWITLWKSGSTSTDDSIYPIVKWLSSSSIMIDPTFGGTSNGPTGSIPTLTARTDVSYRVVDYYAAAHLSGYQTGNYIVFQFDNASDINPGQARSQFQIKCAAQSNPISQLRLRLSPSGSWDGSQFVDALEVQYADIVPDSSNIQEAGSSSPDWIGTTLGGLGSVNIIAGKGFIICQTGGPWIPNNGSCMQVEIPKRLYPQENDPNPICAFNAVLYNITTAGSRGYGYAMRWFPSPHSSTIRRWASMIPGYTGAWWNSNIFSNSSMSALTTGYPCTYNPVSDRYLLMPAVLGLSRAAGQPDIHGHYSIARAQLRSTMFMPAMQLKTFTRLGDGESRWIHVGSGMLWPWDHALVPTRRLFLGWTV